MRKSTLVVAIVLPVLLVAGGYWACAQTVVVTNESGQRIRSLTVEVNGDTSHFGGLSPGGSVSVRFHVGGEANVEVKGRLEDGTEIEENGYYFVWEEVGKRTNLAVQPGGKVVDRR